MAHLGRNRFVLPTAHAPSISHLPPEILLSIFQLVHQETESLIESLDLTWETPDVLSPSRFPNALASVSSQWREIMSLVPAFWSDLVIVVDASQGAINLHDIELAFACTGSHNVDVFVTRQPSSPILPAYEEKELLAPLIYFLSERIDRCRSFSFYATHSSALPLIGRDIHGNLPRITILQLGCDVDDGGDILTDDQWQESHFPNLFQLIINGHNVCNTTHNHRDFLETLPSLRMLGVERLALLPEGIRNTISLHEFLSLLDGLSIDHLMLHDIHPPYEEDRSSPLFHSLWIGGTIILDNIVEGVVLEMLRTTHFSTFDLSVRHSRFDAREYYGTIYWLTLSEIPISANLATTLHVSSISVLVLEECPGFDDNVLRILGGKRDLYEGTPEEEASDNNGEEDELHSLLKLSLKDCPNFTVAALKGMVEMRSLRYNNDFSNISTIKEISVVGRGPSLLPEDFLWFCTMVNYIHWRTVQADGMICHYQFGTEGHYIG